MAASCSSIQDLKRAEECIQKAKPRTRPDRIRFNVILSAFCRRVCNGINLPTERELRACLRQNIYLVIRKREIQRLIHQAAIIRPTTERLFREIGLRPGMRVLDLGCGAGDVSILAAELVGPKGVVMGIDRNPEVLSVARERSREARSKQIEFKEASVESLSDLMRAFQSGVPHYDVGRRMVEQFSAAQLPQPKMFCELPVGGGFELRPFGLGGRHAGNRIAAAHQVGSGYGRDHHGSLEGQHCSRCAGISLPGGWPGADLRLDQALKRSIGVCVRTGRKTAALPAHPLYPPALVIPRLCSEVVTFCFFVVWWPESPQERAAIRHPRGTLGMTSGGWCIHGELASG